MKRKRIRKSDWWLPIDSRLIGHPFSFRRIRGAARAFLIVEMILATAVVIGAIVILCLKFSL